MKDKWTQQFQEKMDGYEMAAPEMEWADIDKALAKNRRPALSVIWGRRIAAAAAVALLLIGGAKVLMPGADDERGLVADNTEAPRQNLGERWLETQGEDKLAAVEERTKTARTGNQTRTANQEKTDEPELAMITEKPTTTAAIEESDIQSSNETEKSGNAIKQSGGNVMTQSGSNVMTQSGSTAIKRNRRHDINRRSKMGGELMAAVYMQNAMDNNGTRGMGGVYSSPVMNTPYGTVSDEFRVGSLDFLAESNPKTVNFDHDHPIKVGMSVKYCIDDRWSLSSGLTYSYLRSTFDYSEGKVSGSGVQKLHYVGIPLAASYNVVSGKKLKLYVTAGGEMQKLVSGKATMDGVNVPEENKKQDIREGGMQWSLNAAAGVEYNIVDNLGIYLEPGVTHYIDNNSDVDNYYKYKPTNFSLNVGLRLSIR